MATKKKIQNRTYSISFLSTVQVKFLLNQKKAFCLTKKETQKKMLQKEIRTYVKVLDVVLVGSKVFVLIAHGHTARFAFHPANVCVYVCVRMISKPHIWTSHVEEFNDTHNDTRTPTRTHIHAHTGTPHDLHFILWMCVCMCVCVCVCVCVSLCV